MTLVARPPIISSRVSKSVMDLMVRVRYDKYGLFVVQCVKVLDPCPYSASRTIMLLAPTRPMLGDYAKVCENLGHCCLESNSVLLFYPSF